MFIFLRNINLISTVLFGMHSCKKRDFYPDSNIKTIQVTTDKDSLKMRAFWIGRSSQSEDPKFVYSGKCKVGKVLESLGTECTQDILVVPVSGYLDSLNSTIKIRKNELKGNEELLDLKAIQIKEQEYADQFKSEMAKPNLSDTLSASLTVNHKRLINQISERQNRIEKLNSLGPESLKELEDPNTLTQDLMDLLSKKFTVSYHKTKESSDSPSSMRADLVWTSFFSVIASEKNSDLKTMLSSDLLEVATQQPITIVFKSSVTFERKAKNKPITSVPAALIGNQLFVSLGYPKVTTMETPFGADPYKRSLSDVVFGRPYCRMEAEMRPSPVAEQLEYADQNELLNSTYRTIPSFKNPERHLVFYKIIENKYRNMEKFFLSCGIADESADLFKDGKNNSRGIDFGLFGEKNAVTIEEFANIFSDNRLFTLSIGETALN